MSRVKKYLLFDNDGVLVETEYWYFKATQMALADIGVELTETYYQTCMPGGLGCWHLASDAGIDAKRIEEQKSERNQYYQHFLRSEVLDIPKVEGVLKALSSDYKMAIVTTSKKDDFKIIHEHRPILKYMSFVLASGDYARAKPYPDPYLLGLEKFNATKSEILVIEDSERGLRSAVAAGIDCALVHNGFTAGQNFAQATYKLNHLTELPGLLAKLNA